MDNNPTKKNEYLKPLLAWLSENPDQANTEYIRIQEGLARFFRFKGCSDEMTLAAQTLDRVNQRVNTFDESNDVKKTTIIYGFARNVAFEHLRQKKKESEAHQTFETNKPIVTGTDDKKKELRLDCMEACLKKLSKEDRKIFINYYGREDVKRSVTRKELAGYLGCTPNALGVRIFRARKDMKECIEKCVEKKM